MTMANPLGGIGILMDISKIIGGNQNYLESSCSSSSSELSVSSPSETSSSSSSSEVSVSSPSEASSSSSSEVSVLSPSGNSEASNSEKQEVRFPLDIKKSSPVKMQKCLCRWSGCTENISSPSKLIEHLQLKHVNTQTFSESFVCLWTGCKVYNRASCSRSWLERHVISHGGNRPFRCIIDGCGGQRFSSQIMLERHINRHFNKPTTNNSVKSTAIKLIRRNGQKLRYRRQPFSARGRTDIFDQGIMSQLQFILVEMTKNCERLSIDVMSSKNFLHISFEPKVIARRTDLNGDICYLVRWYPYNALDDEWLPGTEISKCKSVPLWKLPQNIQEPFWNNIFPNRRSKPSHQSRKYKSAPQPQ